MSREWSNRGLRLAGVALLAGLAWQFLDVSAVARALSSLPPAGLLALVLLALTSRLIMAYKWFDLCRDFARPVRLAGFFRLYLTASFLNYCLPSTIGGDIYRGAALAKRVPRHATSVAASLVVERGVGAVATLLAAWFGLVYLAGGSRGGDLAGIGVVLLAISIAGAGAIGVAFRPSMRRRVPRLLQRWHMRRAASQVRRFDSSFRALLADRARLVHQLALAFAANTVQLAILLIAGILLRIDVAAATLLAILAVSQLVRRVAMAADGWSLGELSNVAILGLAGIPTESAVALSLTGHAAAILAAAAGGLALLGGNRAVAMAHGTLTLRRAVQRFLVPRVAVTIYYFFRYRARVSPHAEVELSSNLVFGRGCVVSSFTKIKATHGPVRVGRRGGFGAGCFISTREGGIEIGDNFICGPNVNIVAANYVHDRLDVHLEDQGHTSRGIRIGSNVWIGAGSSILDGAVIGDNSIVVANSLVNRRFPPNSIIQGNPAKVLMRRRSEDSEAVASAAEVTQTTEAVHHV